MFILQCLLCLLSGYAFTRLGILPCHWEWWVIVVTMLSYAFFGFHLGLSTNKKKEETPDAE